MQRENERGSDRHHCDGWVRVRGWGRRWAGGPAAGRAAVPAAGSAGQLHFRPVAQAIAAFRHDDFPDAEALGDGDALAVDHTERYRAHRRRLVGIHDVDKGTHDSVGRTAAHRRIGYGDLMRQQLLQQLDVDELVRKQETVGVLELRPQLDRARGDVDCIVEGEQNAVREFGAVGAIVGLHLQRAAALQLPHHGRYIVFGNGKNDRDRLKLVDEDDAVGVARRDVIALVYLPQPDSARDRRGDARVR